MSELWYTIVYKKMSTKVISAKFPSEEYDRIVERCNELGCSISDYVREKCSAEFNESEEKVEQEKKESVDAELTKKNPRLEIDLVIANERIDRLKKQNNEFSELFSSQEIVNRKIQRSADRMKFGCIKLCSIFKL